MRKIRVLVVEDSRVYRDMLVSSINNDPALTVVGTAGDPFEARDKIYTGEIVDSKTIIAILAYFDMQSKGIFKS